MSYKSTLCTTVHITAQTCHPLSSNPRLYGQFRWDKWLWTVIYNTSLGQVFHYWPSHKALWTNLALFKKKKSLDPFCNEKEQIKNVTWIVCKYHTAQGNMNTIYTTPLLSYPMKNYVNGMVLCQGLMINLK